MTEIIFLVEIDDDGGYVAQALGESIITQAEDLETLKKEVQDAVHYHFPDETFGIPGPGAQAHFSQLLVNCNI